MPEREARPQVPPLSLDEQRWAGIAVRHLLRTQTGNDREYLRDGAGQEAEIKIVSLRVTLARMPGGERDGYAVKSLGHHLCGWTGRELWKRKELDPPRDPESEEEPPEDLPDERDTDWDERIAGCLFEDIGDERLATAFRALPPVQQETLNLHYFHRIPLPGIARLLNAPEETVNSRWERALARLRQALGVAKAKGQPLPRPPREK